MKFLKLYPNIIYTRSKMEKFPDYNKLASVTQLPKNPDISDPYTLICTERLNNMYSCAVRHRNTLESYQQNSVCGMGYERDMKSSVITTCLGVFDSKHDYESKRKVCDRTSDIVIATFGKK
jgi:hypothetical protein